MHKLKPLGGFVLWTAIFALAYGQAPLYFSNQNQYFLHGLADAGYGHLDEDWLANTKDPTPLFSLLVAGTYCFLNAAFFYLFYALLMGGYFFALMGFFTVVAGDKATRRNRLIFAAIIILIHSALLRWASARLFGVDYAWYFQAGVAGQYILGPMFQPSTFGVILLLSILAYAKERPLLAVTISSLGAVLHTTYLLPAAMLTVFYMSHLAWQRQWKKATLVGGWALVLVSPIVIYNLMQFRPSSAEVFAQAQHILVHFRIPHHAIVRLWLDEIAMLQIAWLVLGIACAYRTRLFPVLWISFALAVALTIVQVITNNDTLALIFPWRVSTILMPVATAVIVSRFVVWLWGSAETWGLSGIVSAATIGILVVSGILIMVYRQGFQTRDEELVMMAWVKDHNESGEVYALPVPVPELKKIVRGSFKSDFKPLPDLQKDARFIPVNLQRFRLYTGAPIFVDFKSIPYADRDVIKWRKRLDINEQLFNALKKENTNAAIDIMRNHGITHVVVTPDYQIDDPRLVREYNGRYYQIFRFTE